jgi:HEAT repeat protein
MNARWRTGFPTLALLLAVPAACWSADADPELAYAEKALQDARLPVDGPSLLKFFQARTLSEADRNKLASLIPLLGDDNFAVRDKAYKQLQAAGQAALPFLRQGLSSPDAEIAGRAGRLARALESGSDTALTIAAARVLAARKPAGAARALLAYLPLAAEEYVQDELMNSLAKVGIQDGKVKEVLAAALKDRDPLRRMAAASVHGQGGPEARKTLPALLQDPDPRVRFQAASALVKAGDRQAVSVLVSLLSDGPPATAWTSESLLLRIAGDKAPLASLDASDQQRKACREAWAAWWKENQLTIDLAKVNFADTPLGLTLVCDVDTGKDAGGRLWEFGPDGKERWQYAGVRVITDVQLLPGRRLLLAEGANYQVSERDRAGKILWTHKTDGYATTALRLRNGNTLIGGYSAIKEVTPQGKIVFSYSGTSGSIYRVKQLRNGNLLFPTGGQVVEIDKSGKQVRKVTIPGGTGIWAHVELLPNGRYLVSQYSANKVIELDATGKVHWQVTVTTPSSASQLPNGNILVSSMDARRVVIFNRAGKEVWSQKTQGRPFLVKRY